MPRHDQWHKVQQLCGNLQGLTQGPMMFNVFINNLGDGTECILSKFAQNTKLGGTVQGDVDGAEKQGDRNLMKFNKKKYGLASEVE